MSVGFSQRQVCLRSVEPLPAVSRIGNLTTSPCSPTSMHERPHLREGDLARPGAMLSPADVDRRHGHGLSRGDEPGLMTGALFRASTAANRLCAGPRRSMKAKLRTGPRVPAPGLHRRIACAARSSGSGTGRSRRDCSTQQARVFKPRPALPHWCNRFRASATRGSASAPFLISMYLAVTLLRTGRDAEAFLRPAEPVVRGGQIPHR